MRLKAIGPAEKDKEFDVFHLEHTLQRHRDQKGTGQIRQSVFGYQTGGREDSPLKQFGVEMYCCLSNRE